MECALCFAQIDGSCDYVNVFGTTHTNMANAHLTCYRIRLHQNRVVTPIKPGRADETLDAVKCGMCRTDVLKSDEYVVYNECKHKHCHLRCTVLLFDFTKYVGCGLCYTTSLESRCIDKWMKDIGIRRPAMTTQKNMSIPLKDNNASAMATVTELMTIQTEMSALIYNNVEQQKNYKEPTYESVMRQFVYEHTKNRLSTNSSNESSILQFTTEECMYSGEEICWGGLTIPMVLRHSTEWTYFLTNMTKYTSLVTSKNNYPVFVLFLMAGIDCLLMMQQLCSYSDMVNFGININICVIAGVSPDDIRKELERVMKHPDCPAISFGAVARTLGWTINTVTNE